MVLFQVAFVRILNAKNVAAAVSGMMRANGLTYYKIYSDSGAEYSKAFTKRLIDDKLILGQYRTSGYR